MLIIQPYFSQSLIVYEDQVSALRIVNASYGGKGRTSVLFLPPYPKKFSLHVLPCVIFETWNIRLLYEDKFPISFS